MTPLRHYWGLVGYIALVAITVLVVQIYGARTQNELKKTQQRIVTAEYQACINSERLATNQERLVRSVLSLVTQPQFKQLGLPQEQMEFVFFSVLTNIPLYKCQRPSWYPPPATERRPIWWPPPNGFYPKR